MHIFSEHTFSLINSRFRCVFSDNVPSNNPQIYTRNFSNAFRDVVCSYYDVRVFFAIIKTQIESIIEETHKFYQF